MYNIDTRQPVFEEKHTFINWLYILKKSIVGKHVKIYTRNNVVYIGDIYKQTSLHIRIKDVKRGVQIICITDITEIIYIA